MPKTIRFIIILAITVLVLFFLFSKVNFSEVGNAFLKSNKVVFLFAVLVFFTSTLFGALRWKKVMKLADCDIPYKTVLATYLANIPVSKISPLNSGDLARAFYLKDKIPISKNVGIVFAENLLDIMLVSFFSLLGGLILKINMVMMAGAVVFLLSSAFFVFVPKIKLNIKNEWKIKLENFSNIFGLLIKNPYSFLLVIFYTFLMWLAVLICFKILFISFSINVSMVHIMASQPIIILLGLIPITLSGIGIRESSMVYFYYSFAPISSIMAAALTYSFLAAILLPLACLPFLFRVLLKIKKQ